MNQLKVHHFGPDPSYVGGMASVIRVLTDHRVGADAVVYHPTWRLNARFAGVFLTLRATVDLLRMQGGDVAHIHLAENGSFIREGALVVLARILGRTTIVTIHGANFLPFARRHRWLVSFVLGCPQTITCLDRDVFDLVRQSAPRARTELVPNPVPMDRGALGADKTQEIVVFAGEISLRKGADVLWRAWQLVVERRPEALCIMVGPRGDFSVPETERLEVRSAADTATIRDLLRSARVVALPSRAEGMPMVLTEAMSAGRPFVSTPVGGIPDLAQEGGILVPVEDHVGLAERLIDFLASPRFAHELGERGRQFCLATRSVEVVDARLRELYSATMPTP